MKTILKNPDIFQQYQYPSSIRSPITRRCICNRTALVKLQPKTCPYLEPCYKNRVDMRTLTK